MRVALVSSLLVLAACGGSKKPAEAASSETPETAASAAGDTAPTADSASAATEGSSAPATADAPAGSAAASETAPSHPVPAATGLIDGKPFSPRAARITSRMQKDGRILITLDERSDCAASGAKPGDGVLTMIVPWENGYKTDLGALKRASRKSAGEIGFARINKHRKKEVSPTFKASGRVTIVKAPMEQNAIGKMKIDLQSGDYMLAGDLDIQVCVPPK